MFDFKGETHFKCHTRSIVASLKQLYHMIKQVYKLKLKSKHNVVQQLLGCRVIHSADPYYYGLPSS